MKHITRTVVLGLIAASSTLMTQSCGKGPVDPYLHEDLSQTSGWQGQWDVENGAINFDGKSEFENIQPTRIARDTKDATHCEYDVTPETESVKAQLLKDLSHTWKLFYKKKEGGWENLFLASVPSYQGFEFDSVKKKAATSGDGLFTTSESMNYKKICISTPLVRKDGYNGMRVVEMEAENNEGTAAFAFRFKPHTTKPGQNVLMITQRHYERWGQENKNLLPVDEIFKTFVTGKRGVPIRVYLSE